MDVICGIMVEDDFNQIAGKGTYSSNDIRCSANTFAFLIKFHKCINANEINMENIFAYNQSKTCTSFELVTKP